MKTSLRGIAYLLITFVATAMFAVPVMAQDEDVSGSFAIDAPEGGAVEIGAMTIPHVVLDFDSMAAGNTTVGDIQSAFPGSALSDLTFSTVADTGNYDFQTGGGRALAANSDGSGALVLIDPSSDFGDPGALIINLGVRSTEIGFEIGDWSGPFNVNLFDGATLVGSVQVSTEADDREHFVQSGTLFNTIELTANPDNPGGDWVVPALHLPEGGEPGRATFFVTKNFDDDNTAEVEVTLSCNTGLPLEQTTSIAEGDPVNFVVVDFEDGTLDCEVTEVVPAGYSVQYDNETTLSSESCTYEDIDGVTSGTNACIITNSLNEVEVEVTKVWIDENPQFNAQNVAGASWSCNNVAFPCELGIVNGCDSGNLDFFGNPGEDSFFVFPDWESGTTCSITEVDLLESGIEVDDSECQGLVVFPGAGASCTIFNTRLFEGIPTLSQYGLGLLALLMLGMGFVAFRRVI